MKTHIFKQLSRDFISCLVFTGLIYIAVIQFIFNEPKLHYLHWTIIASLAYAAVRWLVDVRSRHRYTPKNSYKT